jgi:branched-chain amino acid transport system ATP-binding protein
MGQVPEGRLVFKNLTVAENLEVGGAILPRSTLKSRLDAVYNLFPRLAERRDQAAGLMSGGEQQMLALGRALAASPRILLIDELSLGLAPLIVSAIYKQLSKVRDDFGTALLIVEQNARLALRICDYAYVLERGVVVMHGTAAEISSSARMREAYLGARSTHAEAAV